MVAGATPPPSLGRHPYAKAYGVVAFAVLLVTLVRLPLEPMFHGRAPYALYYLPILWAAWYGGVGPTVAAIALSLASSWAFVVPGAQPGYRASIMLFLIASGGIVLLARLMRKSQEAQLFLGSVLESSDDAIVTKNLQSTIQSWNAGAQRLFGYSADEVIGRSVTLLIPPELQDEEGRILDRLKRGERIEHFETVRVAKDGRRIEVSLTVSPVRDRFGRIIGASKVARDISERKRAAAEIASQREWLCRTLESIGDAVIAADDEERIVFLNPVAERLTGWNADDARGRRCADIFRLVNERTREEVESPITRVLKLGTTVELANGTMLVASDGTERPIDDSAAPIRDSEGRIVGVVLVFRDVSERKRAEAERRAAVAERERLLSRERAARDEAEQANRSKDEFVAMVSHELRTPLNAIMGWTQILKRTPDELETTRRGIEVIERNAISQAQLISDLLDMSRIISGKLQLDVQDIDLVALSRTAVETTVPAAEAKNITLELSVDQPAAATTGDATRIQQCIWNLLSNAVKFTPSGGRVGLRLSRLGSNIEVRVWDTGIGIPKDFLPYVFDRFRQAETGSPRRTGGLGLGLAIVKQLVELHGGHVCAESAGDGKGATFTLTLPVRALRTNVAPARPAPEADALERVRVLVVEDDPDNREVLRRLLEQHRAVVGAASSAGEALEMLPSVRPHVVVSDIGLPEVDGYELIQRIRRVASGEGGAVPAIALTARASAEDRAHALRVGYQAHIAKPVAPADLVAKIASLAASQMSEG